VRDSSGKPGVRHERGLAADSPTRRGTPKIRRAGNAEKERAKSENRAQKRPETVNEKYGAYSFPLPDL